MLKELHKLTDIGYATDERTRTHYPIIKPGMEEFIKSISVTPNGKEFNYLQYIDNTNVKLHYKGRKNVGYMFYEDEKIKPDMVERLKEFDVIATGSTWSTEVVKNHGFENVKTVIQGVDCDLFKPKEKELLKDKFVIFSGGKLEPRKAQDIVAFVAGKFQQKYKDVRLVTLWGNIFTPDEIQEKNVALVMKYLVKSQTMIFDFLTQEETARVIAESDIGIFPNRCEGGTNLVMMEYMACGKPVIATNTTGQKDVLKSDYAFLVEGKTNAYIIDSCYDYLEYAYKNRDELKEKGKLARQEMEGYTWNKTADIEAARIAEGERRFQKLRSPSHPRSRR